MTNVMHETYKAHDVKELQNLTELVKSKFQENTFGPGVILNSMHPVIKPL